MSEMERLGRETHSQLGKGVWVRNAFWEGPEAPGETGRTVFQKAFFPIDQSRRAAHPRHPSGYDAEGRRVACVSPSCSFYRDLCRYAGFRWGRSQ